MELVSLSEHVTKLRAICQYCKCDASYTKRTIADQNVYDEINIIKTRLKLLVEVTFMLQHAEHVILKTCFNFSLLKLCDILCSNKKINKTLTNRDKIQK